MANFIKNMDDPGITKSYTIPSDGWDTNQCYTITDGLITTGTNESTQFISFNPSLYDDDLYNELLKANIRVLSVTSGSIILKALGVLPVHDLPITITHKIGVNAVALTMDSMPSLNSQNPITSDGVYKCLQAGTKYYDESTSPALVYNTTYLPVGAHGLKLFYNPYLKLISVQINFPVAAQLTSGTTYDIATIPDSIASVIGECDVQGTANGIANNTTATLGINTTTKKITLMHRNSVAKSAVVIGTLTCFI